MDLTFTYADIRDFPYEVLVNISINRRHESNAWLNIHIPDSGDGGNRDEWLWTSVGDQSTNTMIYRFKHAHHAALFALTWT